MSSQYPTPRVELHQELAIANFRGTLEQLDFKEPIVKGFGIDQMTQLLQFSYTYQNLLTDAYKDIVKLELGDGSKRPEQPTTGAE